ncbi:MAG: ABC1 kinase family protein [Bacillus sp. (in: firmicutes)]
MRKKEKSKPTTEDSTSAVRLREVVSVLRRHDIIRGVTPEKLRLILEDLGPTYVKIGQIMSMRSDMLPVAYCEELMKLRAEVKPLPFEEVVMMIEKEYGKPVGEVFRFIDEKPLGSASIAQVHRIELPDGRKAVAKVQRPGIHGKMAQDIALLKKAAKLIQHMEISGDAIDFNSVIEEMWSVAQEEMDFLKEANNARQFHMLHQTIHYVAFPEIIDELTTSRILVMEFIEGCQIDNLPVLAEKGYDMEEVGMKLAENYLKQVLDDGFFHADPHPGNIWIREGKIIWLDLGMVGRLSKRDRKLFQEAIMAIVEQDIIELKSIVLSIGQSKKRINHAMLYNDIETTLGKYGELDFEFMNLGEVLQDMIEICNHHDIAVPSRITMLGRGIVTLEGVLRVCCPNVSFVDLAAAHLSTTLWDNIDLFQETKSAGKSIYQIGKKAIEIPKHLSDFLNMLVKGQAKVNLDVTGAEEPIRQLDHMVDKLIICIISAALLIGSSLISTTNMKPQVLDIPLFGILGFIASAILSLWLLFGIIKRAK